MDDGKNLPPIQADARAPADWPERVVTADVLKAYVVTTRVRGGTVQEPDADRILGWRKSGERLQFVFEAMKRSDGRWLVKRHPSFARIRSWVE